MRWPANSSMLPKRIYDRLPEGQQQFLKFGMVGGVGFVVDAGKNKLDRSLPRPSPAVMLEAGRAAVRYMNGLGITAWLDAAASGVT